MLSDIHYDDMDVVNLLITGIRTAGNLERIGIWRPDTCKKAKTSIEELWEEAPAIQKEVLKDRHEGWSEVDQAVWDLTLEEVAAGSLKGPLTPEELKTLVGPRWIAARRFPVVQGAKVRPVDDYSEFGQNATFGSVERVVLKGLDQVATWLRAWLDTAGRIDTVSRRGSFLDTSGRVWEFVLAPDWSISAWVDLVGRVADLRSAYKQLANHPAHASINVVAVRSGPSGVKLFRALALMFGASSAVYSFLRFSRALSALALKLLNLVTVEFFDDFTQIESSVLADSA